MRSSRWTPVVLILSTAAVTVGCGIIIGNPGNPVDGGDSANYVQTIDYDIPTTVSGYELVQNPPSNDYPDKIFDDSAHRIDRTIDRVNDMIKRLNHDAVRSVGDFTGKGEDGKVSGTIVELSSDPDYNLKATICYDNTPFQVVEWSSTTGSVHTIRNHAVDPVDASRETDMYSEIVYTPGTRTQVDVWVTVTADDPIPGADGNVIADYTVGTLEDGTYTLAGVHNWFDDVADISSEGDEYFSGQFNEAGEGENVTYNTFLPDCTTPFDETATTHVWCGGRAIPNGTEYSDADRAAAAERLKDISVPTKASLKQPVLPADLSCP